MTSPTSAATNLPAARRAGARRRRGFTLVEILVVLGIIIVLAGLLLPSLNKARKAAVRVRMANDLQAIGTALEAYNQDHRGYPRVTTVDAANRGYDGAVVLCQALIGPGNADDLDTDNKPALGFRTKPGGKLYPPYLQSDVFKIGAPVVVEPAIDDPARFAILDRNEKPILYFPASPVKPNVRVVSRIPPYFSASEESRYDASDNLKASSAPFGPFERSSGDADALTRMRLVLGDFNANGVLDNNEQEVDKPYLLWSAGPDEIYGPNAEMGGDTTALDAPDAARCDDVTNFRS